MGRYTNTTLYWQSQLTADQRRVAAAGNMNDFDISLIDHIVEWKKSTGFERKRNYSN